MGAWRRPGRPGAREVVAPALHLAGLTVPGGGPVRLGGRTTGKGGMGARHVQLGAACMLARAALHRVIRCILLVYGCTPVQPWHRQPAFPSGIRSRAAAPWVVFGAAQHDLMVHHCSTRAHLITVCD